MRGGSGEGREGEQGDETGERSEEGPAAQIEWARKGKIR